jgi:hypothetical protein
MQVGNLLKSFRLVKTKGPKSFNYTPLYYNEKKERLDKRKEILQKVVDTESKLSDEQRESLRELSDIQWRRPIYRRASLMSSLRFFIILMALVVLFVWFFVKFGM